MSSAKATDTVLAALISAIHGFCLARGLDRDQLERWGVPRTGYPDPDAFVPYAQGLALWDALQSSFPNEPVGLQFGEFLAQFDVGVVGLASAYCADLGAAISSFVRLQHVLDPCSQVRVEHDGSLSTVVYQADARLALRRHPIEAMLVSAHRTGERLAGTKLHARKVELAHAALGGDSEYQAIFHVKPEHTRRYALTYQSEVLAMPVKHAHRELAKYLAQQAETIGRERPVALETLSSRALGWARGQLGAGTLLADASAQAVMTRAARACGTSSRTMQRQLAAEGTSFRRVLEQALQERAELLLARPDLTIFEVAFLLGYAEPRSFHRAFKRWTGRTPSEHRAQRGDPPSADANAQ